MINLNLSVALAGQSYFEPSAIAPGVFCVVCLISFALYILGKQQPWAIPPPHLELVQKTDPLARKPYKLFALRELNSSASTNKTNSNDNGKLLEESVDGQNYGTNAQELEADLSKKLS